MRRTHLLTGSLLAAAAVCAIPSQAQIQVITAGSSAQFGVFAAAAYKEAQASGVPAYHYTAKSSQCTGGVAASACVFIKDSRSIDILPEPANIWIVWTEATGATAPTKVWAYMSVDSTVGVRSFLAVPRATVGLASEADLPVPSATSNPNLNVWNDGSVDTALTSANAKGVYNVLSAHALTAANTDIRPEDALFATNRVLTTLGYKEGTTSPLEYIGYPIESYFTTTTNEANAVSFALSGKDPITGDTTVPFVTIPVGAAPITFLVNRSNPSGLGYKTGSSYGITNLVAKTTHNAGKIFSGAQCDTSLFAGGPSTPAPLNVILREPTSGTMNTTEYSTFDIYDGGSSPDGLSQETGITGGAPSTTTPPPEGNNPLYKPCTKVGSVTGTRYRAVGTGDEFNAIKNVSATSPYSSNPIDKDQIGYIFFSYEATNSEADSTVVNYLTLDSVDPLTTAAYTGEIPLCSKTTTGIVSPVTNCAATVTSGKYASFPSLRAGTYRAWSEYRVITDSTGLTAANALVAQANSIVDTELPDFVPFTPVCAATKSGAYDAGLDVYRQHFTQSGITGDDGPVPTVPATGKTYVSCSNAPTELPYLTLGGGTGTGAEAGGDVGGLIEGPFTANPTVPGPTGSHQ
jgi:hypothetical protein